MSRKIIVHPVSLKSEFAESNATFCNGSVTNEEHHALYSELDRTSDHCHCHITRASWDRVAGKVLHEHV